MNINSALASLGIKESDDVFTGVRTIRELIQNPDPSIEMEKSKEVLKVLGIEDSVLTDSDSSRARLFVTSLVSVALTDRENFDLDAAIEAAKVKVDHLEKMGLVQKGKVVAKAKKDERLAKAPKEKKEKVVKEKTSRVKADLAKAIAIFNSSPDARVYDLVTQIAEAYSVDRAKAYGFLHKARKEAGK